MDVVAARDVGVTLTGDWKTTRVDVDSWKVVRIARHAGGTWEEQHENNEKLLLVCEFGQEVKC